MKMNIIVKIINRELNLARGAVLTKAKKNVCTFDNQRAPQSSWQAKSKYTVITSICRCKCITNRKYKLYMSVLDKINVLKLQYFYYGK